MTFAESGTLLLLPLALAPVAVYFFLRLKKKRVVFPSLSVFGGLRPSEIARVNFFRYAVIFLRCLFLFLVIAAFSRPYADWSLPSFAAHGRMKEALDLVILFDESYSMSAVSGGRTVFEEDRSLAREIVKDLSENSAVSFVFFAGKVRSSTGFMPPGEALAKMPGEPSFSYSGTDYGSALEKAQNILSTRPGRKKIVFVASDGAANGARGILRNPEGAEAFAPGFREGPLNFWFDGVKASRSSGEKDPTLEISGKLRASKLFSGTARVRHCSLSSCGNWRPVEFKKETVSAFRLSLKANEDCGYLQISGDSLPADDRHYVCAGAGPGKAAFLYSGRSAYVQGGPAYFAREIFNLLKAENPFFDADILEAGTVDEKKLSSYSRIFSFAVSSPGVLKSLAEGRSAFFLVPADPEKDFSFFQSRFPGLRGKTYSGEFSLSASGGKFTGAGEYELDRVYVRNFYALTNPDAVEPLLSVKAGNAFYPAFFRFPGVSSESYAFSFSADILNSNIALKPVFLQILRKTAERDLAGESSSFFTGAIPFPGKSRPSAVFSLSASGASPAGGPEFKCEKPGAYRGDFGGEALYFSCNADPASGESSLEKADSFPWTSLPRERFVEEFRNRVYKSGLYDFLLIFAAVALILENFIIWKYF